MTNQVLVSGIARVGRRGRTHKAAISRGSKNGDGKGGIRHLTTFVGNKTASSPGADNPHYAGGFSGGGASRSSSIRHRPNVCVFGCYIMFTDLYAGLSVKEARTLFQDPLPSTVR